MELVNPDLIRKIVSAKELMSSLNSRQKVEHAPSWAPGQPWLASWARVAGLPGWLTSTVNNVGKFDGARLTAGKHWIDFDLQAGEHARALDSREPTCAQKRVPLPAKGFP